MRHTATFIAFKLVDVRRCDHQPARASLFAPAGRIARSFATAAKLGPVVNPRLLALQGMLTRASARVLSWPIPPLAGAWTRARVHSAAHLVGAAVRLTIGRVALCASVASQHEAISCATASQHSTLCYAKQKHRARLSARSVISPIGSSKQRCLPAYPWATIPRSVRLLPDLCTALSCACTLRETATMAHAIAGWYQGYCEYSL